MKIAYLSSNPFLSLSESFGDAIRIRHTIEGLRRRGHEILSLIPAENRAFGSSPRWRKQVKPFIPKSVWGTVKDIAFLRHSQQFFQENLEKVRRFRPDLVFDFSAYLHDGGIRIAEALQVPIVLEVEGPALELRAMDGPSCLDELGVRFEKRKYERADRIITVSDPLKRFLVSQGVAAEKIDVIPNGVDLEKFDIQKVSGASIRKRYGLTDQCVVGFVGVFSDWYALDRLVEVVCDLHRKGESVHLLLVGDGQMRLRLETLARLWDPSAVTITGFVPHEEVPQYVAAMDIAVITNHQWWCSPLKLFEYGAMRKPVVAAQLDSIASFVPEEEVCWVQPGHSNELRQKLLSLIQDSDRRECYADRLYRTVCEKYAASVLEEKMEQVLEGVLEGAVA